MPEGVREVQARAKGGDFVNETHALSVSSAPVPRSALIVAVAEAEPLVGEWRLRYDNALLGIPAHVTLLFPFVPAENVDEALFGEIGRAHV